MIHPNFEAAISHARDTLKVASHKVHTANWQGIDITSKPEMATHEVLNYSLQVGMDGEDLRSYRAIIKPNLPWADDHFDERVCGEPINPGVQWAKWPWGQNAKKFLDLAGQFNHNYMERYWPCFAGMTKGGKLDTLDNAAEPIEGIRHHYGDLNDVVDHLARDPLSRQAYLPIFFPEDTGVTHGDRVPCSLGHQFILRNGYFHYVYYIRSCDMVRHFQDDIYLSVRLHLWMLQQLRARFDGGSIWDGVAPGFFTMHITSLHMFANDYIREFSNADQQTPNVHGDGQNRK